MPKIIVTRYIKLFSPKMADANIKIVVDGTNYGSLPWKGAKEIEVAPGKHTIKATLLMECSREYDLELKDGEVKKLEVQTNPAKRRIILILVFASIIASIIFREQFHPVSTMVWIVSILLGIVPVLAANILLYRNNSLIILETK